MPNHLIVNLAWEMFKAGKPHTLTRLEGLVEDYAGSYGVDGALLQACLTQAHTLYFDLRQTL